MNFEETTTRELLKFLLQNNCKQNKLVQRCCFAVIYEILSRFSHIIIGTQIHQTAQHEFVLDLYRLLHYLLSLSLSLTFTLLYNRHASFYSI